MNMIEVFRTDVTCPIKALEIVNAIIIYEPTIEANFDLEDCDHVFRIRTKKNDFDLPALVIKRFEMMGHCAALLEDGPLQTISLKAFIPIYEKRGIDVVLRFI